MQFDADLDTYQIREVQVSDSRGVPFYYVTRTDGEPIRGNLHGTRGNYDGGPGVLFAQLADAEAFTQAAR